MHILSVFQFVNLSNFKNALFHLKTFGIRSVLRKTFDYLEFTQKYNQWRSDKLPSTRSLEKQRSTLFAVRPKISIIVPVYKTPAEFLRQMLDSVTAQTYTEWELCIADGSADEAASYIFEIIEKYQKQYPNILYRRLPRNLGISGNTNAALELAGGDYVALLDHDDILAPDALFEIVNAINQRHKGIDVLYTDEDKADIHLKRYYDPYFKPDYNLDLLRSCNYITHFFVVKKSLAEDVGGFSSQCNGSQDYDFILKTCEKANSVCHIPKVLYHWRIHPASVAGDPQNKTYAYDSALQALQQHLNRCGENGTVKKDRPFGYYQIEYPVAGCPNVSIYMKNCSTSLKKQIQSISTYKNYRFIQNLQAISGEYLIILHCASKIYSPDWIEQLLGNCQRPGIGIASAAALYRKNHILEAGLVYTPDGKIHSPFYKLHISDPGYCYRAKIQQNCSLVSPYCIMVKADVFKNSFCSFPSSDFIENIWAFCHTLSSQGLNITLLPRVSVLCKDNRRLPCSFSLFNGSQDPFYNPNFSSVNMYRL